jgi:hypothetical protein
LIVTVGHPLMTGSSTVTETLARMRLTPNDLARSTYEAFAIG